MAVSASFLEFVLEQLSASPREITQKKMFGGVGIYADEMFVALLDNDRFYMKADDSNRADFEKEGMPPFQPYPGSYSMSYYEVPIRVLEDRDELELWLEKAYVAASSKKKKSKKRKVDS